MAVSEGTTRTVVTEYELGPYTRARLVFDPDRGMMYEVIEPELTEKEWEVYRAVKDEILYNLNIDLTDREGFRERVRPLIVKYYKKIMKTKKPPEERINYILYYLERDLIGFGKLDPLIRDPNIEDIHVSGVGKPVFVWYTKYDLLPTNVVFEDESELRRHLQKIMFVSGKQVSYTRPIVDATMPGGLRVHIVHEAVSPTGAQVVIRKHRKVPLSVLDLITSGMAPPEVFAYLWTLVENKASILIIGETAAGKTTLLNAIASFIPYNMKIVVVEEVRELNLPHPNVSYLVTKEALDSVGKVTLFDLVKAAMRQRPDYIIVGEIRGEEAYALFQAISLGHGGLSTVHADSPRSLVKRLMMKPLEIPPYMIRELHTIVHAAKVRIGGLVNRYVVEVADLIDIDDERLEPEFTTVYSMRITEEGVKRTYRPEASHALKRISEQKGIPVEYLLNGIKKKTEFLKKAVARGLSYEEFIREITRWWLGVTPSTTEL